MKKIFVTALLVTSFLSCAPAPATPTPVSTVQDPTGANNNGTGFSGSSSSSSSSGNSSSSSNNTAAVGTLQSVLPASYTATPGDKATDSNITYIDDTGRQLNDSTRGQNVYNANVTGAPSAEWVGWLNKDPVMTFKFTKARQFKRITIGFSHTEYAGIALPQNVVINGKSFKLSGKEVPDNRRGDVAFDVDINSAEISIRLERNSNFRWIFVDEVDFAATP